MAADVGGLIADIGLNVAGLRADIKAANAELARGTSEMNRSLGGLKKQIDFVIGGFQGLIGAFGLGTLIREVGRAVDAVDELGESAQAASVKAETLQELRFAFQELGGITQQQTDMALQRFNRVLGDALRGVPMATKEFRALGVQIRENGRAIETEAGLERVLEQLAAITDDSLRASRASKLFGEEMGPKLAAALGGGIEQLARTREEVVGLISEQRVRDASLLDDAFKRMAATIGGTLKSAIVGVTADLAEMFGLIDRGTEGRLQRELEGLERRIRALQEADAAGALGGNIILLEEAIKRREELLRQLRIEELRTPFAERQRRFRAEQERAAALAGLGEVRIGASMREPPRDLIVANLQEASRQGMEALSAEVEQASRLSSVGPFKPVVQAAEAAQEEMKRGFASAGEAMGRSLTDMLADAMLGIETNWSEMIKRMLAQAAVQQLFSAAAGAFGGPFGKFLGFLGFGGGKASGGPVEAGKAYVVGERGPELMVPGRSGYIVPNDRLGGVTQYINVQIQTGLPQQIVAELEQIGYQAGAVAGAQLVGAAMKQRPSIA